MRLITPQTLANDAADAWANQYHNSAYNDPEKKKIHKALRALGKQPTPAQVDAVIGNKSWTQPPSCDECGTIDTDAVVEVGETPDYDSNTAYLCMSCIENLCKLVAEQKQATRNEP